MAVEKDTPKQSEGWEGWEKESILLVWLQSQHQKKDCRGYKVYRFPGVEGGAERGSDGDDDVVVEEEFVDVEPKAHGAKVFCPRIEEIEAKEIDKRQCWAAVPEGVGEPHQEGTS
eukprot:CAMPEP_0173417490 /NCGR_PEP_ID=MMETSP1356-20130122/85925_1 /TAXON_ID=77927 ORGANISM="Hemiselmis virescens, Strain PCC157" /NCGR_SAMPLE_ID=MMETSP1356 /ASSEMBLY_ACC=CAM_ASM_000847 /LENGTH=114 /DNA_ID=CAMNT_0014379817 /DNA_START=909 /DNA_END=1253 /DNA_ORIENTATION=-